MHFIKTAGSLSLSHFVGLSTNTGTNAPRTLDKPFAHYSGSRAQPEPAGVNGKLWFYKVMQRVQQAQLPWSELLLPWSELLRRSRLLVRLLLARELPGSVHSKRPW